MRTPAKTKALGKRAPFPRRAFSPSPPDPKAQFQASSTKASSDAKPSVKKAIKPSTKKAIKPSIKKATNPSTKNATKSSTKKAIKPLIKEVTKPLQKTPARSAVASAKAPSSVKSSGTPIPKAAPAGSSGRHTTQAPPSGGKGSAATTRRGKSHVDRKVATPSASKAPVKAATVSVGTSNRSGIRKAATPSASKASAKAVAPVGTSNRSGIRKTARRDSAMDPKLVIKGSRTKKNKIIFDPTN
ncbi:Protein CBG27417 [Caenorhabditis briggsae]|uniref:Protein CBG27417 n=1 Tax=Caenorhabditis briggsae TaxID=6238 RepID=B6IJZ4_CAEBR|nr:Protein CBG27417 [Caenorhabditis briggsae]CAS00224.1 Protein CBG27417 [Caenorhabditis briggsae]